MICAKKLKEDGFEKTDISIDLNHDGHAVYSGINRAKERQNPTRPGVYLWLVLNGKPDEFDVIYAGKAGRGIHKRLSEHQAGYELYRDSDKAKRLREALEKPKKFEVWFKPSDIKCIFEQKVFLNATEEEALILKYRPHLNRSKPIDPADFI